MLCAGVTVYGALRKSGAQSGDWVALMGAGGGLGHLAVQLAAKGMGLRVIGIDSGSKKDFVMECGAEAFIDHADDPEAKVKEVPFSIYALTFLPVDILWDTMLTCVFRNS